MTVFKNFIWLYVRILLQKRLIVLIYETLETDNKVKLNTLDTDWIILLFYLIIYWLLFYFFSYGVVVSVRLMSEKFCAFVNYLEANSAARALRELNGMLFGGNYLVIRYPNNPAPESLTSIKPRNNLNSNKKRIRNWFFK